MSELLLVAVPGIRIDGTGALLHVVLVPRLTGPGTTVQSYGLTDWPGLVRDAVFTVRLRRADGSDTDPFDVTCHSDGDSTVWATFFQPGFAVRPFTGQRTYPDPVVEKTTQHAGRIDGVYREAVIHRGDPAVVRTQLDALSLDTAAVSPVDVNAPVPAFDPPDFHRAIALLREHPHVLRALGLVVDLAIPTARLDDAGDLGEVGVDWAGAPSGVGTAHGRRTAYERVDGRFLARSTRTITGGLVDLGTKSPVTTVDPVTGATSTLQVADWVVTSLDVDGAVARVGDAKEALAADTGQTATLPALRTAGLTLLRRGLGSELVARATRGRGNAGRASAADGPALTADDLVLGYRIDVRMPGHEWHSLTRRMATYTVGFPPAGSSVSVVIGGGPVVEEGHVKPAAVVRGTDGTLRTDETVARWFGANLAIPSHPPAILPVSPDPGPDPAAPHEPMPYVFAWTFSEDPAAPADLPLQFGATYQLRARVVDLAGAGLELDDPRPDRAASPPRTFARQEPVPPPVIPPPTGMITPGSDGLPKVDPAFFGPAGSLDVLVVRSDPAGDAPLPDGRTTYPPNQTRMLLPPAVSFALAEQHGVLSGDDETSLRYARRAMAPPRASAEGRNGRHYTWLPDPVVDGVSVTAFPLSAGAEPSDVAIQAWGADSWPDHDPKTLMLSTGASGDPVSVEWHPAGTVEVSVPPAGQADVELTSSLRANVLGMFAAGAWILGADTDSADTGAPATPTGRTGANSTLATDTTLGRHRTVTPPRTVRVVHAVRRPLAVPHAALQALRGPGDTGAALSDPAAPLFGVDRDSTVQVDVVASWDEWGDSGTPTSASEVVQSLPVGLTDTALPTLRHEFGDTKYRHITYQLTARSRFRRYFAATDPDAAFATSPSVAPVDLPSTARPVPPVVVSIVPAFRWTDSQTGRPDSGLIDGSNGLTGPGNGPQDGTGFATHPGDGPQNGGGFETASGDADGGGTSGRHDRPLADEGPFLSRVRSGGRVRVELGRPWYTTGQGERLAVVLSTGSDGTSPTSAGETNLYRDPLYATPPPAHQPTESARSSPAIPVVHVSDPADPDQQLAVALFEVRYDDDRPFADVVLPTAAATYCPMVRLVLARYQEHSLPGLELSEITTSEAVSVFPARTLVVEKPPGGVQVTLLGVGPSDVANRVEARLEVAPSAGFAGTLSALTDGTPAQGWQQVSTEIGALNQPLGPIVVPPDGRNYRLVVREFENLEQLDPPAAGNVLVQELGRRVVFADVVPL